jgi:hypothetical protein
LREFLAGRPTTGTDAAADDTARTAAGPFVDKREHSPRPVFAPQTIHKRHTSFPAGLRNANLLMHKVFCPPYRKAPSSY